MLATLAGIPLETIEGGQIIALVAVGGGILFMTVWVIASNARSTAVAKEREQSRREIAAYVAEGSMTPEQAERLLASGAKAGSSCCKA